MRNIRLTIQYDGTNYVGWQSQKNGLAIQDVIEETLKRLLGERVRLIGAGRTDAGVHAIGQVANFKTRSKHPLFNIKNGLNKGLPRDIVVDKVEEVHSDFHSRYDAKSKIYRYSLYLTNPIPPFYKNYVASSRYKLDLNRMKKESRHLIGRHDFSSFQGSNSKRRDTIRSIYRLEIKKKARFVFIDIEADGFLYNMARSIVGTLIDVGRGYLKRKSVKKILQSKNRQSAGMTASPKGLCLMKVRYDEQVLRKPKLRKR